MILCEQNKLTLDDPIEKFFTTTNLKGVKIKELLNHTSGLKGWAPLYKEFLPDEIDHTKNLTRMTERIQNDPKLLNNNRGTTEYSCLGYILLTAIVEKVGGTNLGELFFHVTDRSDQTDNLFFAPNPYTLTPIPFVPSGFCPTRNRVTCGEVNDLNAYALGGVSGNAGLFGSATAIHNSLLDLRLAKLDRSNLISQSTFNLFCRPMTNDQGPMTNSYTLGFDTPTPGASQSGTLFSKNTIGHLSHTGCSFWWDLDKDIWVIFLTNALLNDPNKKLFAKFRPALHDSIMKQIS
jgi:CubicO group peptidase (beta-lactamase class C family)